MKKCIKCLLTKKDTDFHINKTVKGGRRNTCKDCVKGRVPSFSNNKDKNIYLKAHEIDTINRSNKERLNAIIDELGSMKQIYKDRIDDLDLLLDRGYAKLDKSLAAGNGY